MSCQMGKHLIRSNCARIFRWQSVSSHLFLKRFKGSSSAFGPNTKSKNEKLEDAVPSYRNNNQSSFQDIPQTVRNACMETAAAPTDERLESLCHTRSSFQDLSTIQTIGQPTPESHPHLLQPLEITNKRSSGHEKDESAQKMFEELLRMEEFSVALEKPEEPVLIPAWLRRFRTKSKGKTEITPGITKMEYKDRRNKLLRLLSSTATGQNFEKHAVIMVGSPTKIMSGDIPYPFHQNADFLYMTGFKEPDAVMILETQQNQPFPDHKMIMFVKPRDRKREIWDGPVSGLDAAKDFFGATESYPISNLIAVIRRKYGNNTHCIWYNLADNSTNPKIHSELISLFNSDKFSYPALHSLSHNTQMLRLIKSQSEIELMKKSAEIAGKAFSRVMLSTRPGLEESVLHAVFEYECKIQGAQLLAFPPVVASGLSANTLHYISNSHIIRNSDLVLMDAGCEYNGYVSDITRTWPVSGKFTKEQRKLYEVVLKVQNHCIEHSKVGVSLDQLHQRMLLTLGGELQRIGFIDEGLTDNTLKKAVAEYCPHHLGHYLGMDTHDTPLIHRGLPLQPGMVITIEPGLYIPKHFYHLPESFRGIGIRIEDDVLITNNGPRVLSANFPKTVEEIEQLLSLRT